MNLKQRNKNPGVPYEPQIKNYNNKNSKELNIELQTKTDYIVANTESR